APFGGHLCDVWDYVGIHPTILYVRWNGAEHTPITDRHHREQSRRDRALLTSRFGPLGPLVPHEEADTGLLFDLVLPLLAVDDAFEAERHTDDVGVSEAQLRGTRHDDLFGDQTRRQPREAAARDQTEALCPLPRAAQV